MLAYLDKIADYSNLRLGAEYYYNSLVFCIIDSIYSINSVYTSTKNTVIRYCKKKNLNMYREYGSLPDDIMNEYTVKDFIEFSSGKTYEYLAEAVFENRQRTSAKNGILKAQAVVEFAEVLHAFGINRFVDVPKMYDNSTIENKIKSIKGQGSGLSLIYFYMLAGNDDLIKADRHIIRFIFEATGKKVTKSEAEKIITDCVENLNNKHDNINSRLIDYTIWNYMSSK